MSISKQLTILIFFMVIAARMGIAKVESKFNDVTRNLNIGDSFDIETNHDEEVRINKRTQIVHISKIEESHWRITGAKAGFTIIELIQFDGTISRRYLVHVGKLAALPKVLKLNKTIDGTFNSHQEWLEQAKACSRSGDCLFKARMTPDATLSLTTFMSTLAPVLAIEHIGESNLLLKILCTSPKEFRDEERRVDQLLDPILASIPRKIICFNPGKGNLNLRAKIVLLAKEHSEQYGIDLNQVDLFAPTQTWTKALRLEDQDAAMHIIAEPESRVLPGTTTELLSGGELQDKIRRDFPESGIAAEEKVGWKLFGLQMIARVELVDEHQVMVNSDLRLSAPKRDNELQSHRLQATFMAKLGQSQLVGKTELQVDDHREQSSFGWKAIPIIGPLLRTSNQAKATHWLCYWIKVEKSDI